MVLARDLAHILNISFEELTLMAARKAVVGKHKQRQQLCHTPGASLSPFEVRNLLRANHLSFRPKTITIAALKGGIGKTFLSTNVAVRCAQFGAKVLLIDLDPEACATNSLLTEEQQSSPHKLSILEVLKFSRPFMEAVIPTKYEFLSILPSSLRVSKSEMIVSGKNPKNLLRKYLATLDFDFIFFELPPAFSTLNSSAYLASDEIIIPCTPSIHSLESVDLTIEAINEVAREFECSKANYHILMNRFNPSRYASQDIWNLLQEDYKDALFPFSIRESAEIQNAINAGLSIYETKISKGVREGMDQLMRYLIDFIPAKKKTLRKGASTLSLRSSSNVTNSL